MPRNAPIDISIVGANELAKVAARLKAAGEPGKGLRKELLRRLRGEAKPLVTAVRKSADDVLPRRGGLAALRKKGVAVRTRATGPNASVRVIGKQTGDALNAGRLRHPVFGDRKKWAQQSVRPGWFTTPLEQHAPEVREALLRAIDDIKRKVEA